MKLKKVVASNFKRFSDLTVEIPKTARLIVLVGPNGCGKSSFFDALQLWGLVKANLSFSDDQEYYNKGGVAAQDQRYVWDRIKVDFHEQSELTEEQRRKSFYFRTAHRNSADLNVDTIERHGDPLSNRRTQRTIENDAAVLENYQRLSTKVFKIFDLKSPISSDKFVESIVSPIRVPMSNLFPDLVLNGLADPMMDGTFRFTKGISECFHFKNLSGGEKAAFDLILDLVVASDDYDDTTFCIDEPELHTNNRVQADMLSVLYALIPDNCQLILATHSIGIMRRAKELSAENPGKVIFLDFDRNFDKTVVIKPTNPSRDFWNKIHAIALDDMASLVAPDRVVICEGEPRNRESGMNYSHDARCYEKIFGKEFPEVQFVPGGNADEVIGDKRGIKYVINWLAAGTEVVRLIDRDARSKEERKDLLQDSVKILTKRNLESYLFDDEVLKLLCASVGKGNKFEELSERKKSIGTGHRSRALDDLKPVSGQIYVVCKDVLELTDPGNDSKTFMRDTLASLVEPGTGVYELLKSDIFGEESTTNSTNQRL